jgi:ABC-type iron transport system FetAB permease component
MDVIIFSVVFVIWYIAALILSETMGKKRKIGVEWSFFIAFMLSPVIGYIACLMSKKVSGQQSAVNGQN